MADGLPVVLLNDIDASSNAQLVLLVLMYLTIGYVTVFFNAALISQFERALTSFAGDLGGRTSRPALGSR